MQDYSSILVPVDFSPTMDCVLRRAVRESALHSARLTLLHIIEFYPEDVPPGLVPPENVDPGRVYLKRAEDHLAELVREIGLSGIERVALTCTGAAYHEIIRFAKDKGVDLIVMGYAGRWVTDALGSTAMAVTRSSSCDVLLVREASGPA